MHEWLSGGVSPCQGEGRGFESRLVLFLIGAEAFINKASALFIYASNGPKSVLARDLGDCRDNLRNSQSVFLIVS